MPTSRESNIEDFAYDYLHSYYTTRMGVKTLLVNKAEKTKQGLVADGLFSLKNSDKGIFIASLSTKASNRIAYLLTRYKKRGLSKWRYLSTILLAAATVYLIGLQLEHWAALVVLPALVAVMTFLLHSFLEKRHLKNKIRGVLNGIRKLPADEQWLGISISSLALRNNSLAKHLLDSCQRRGIGVITVGKRAKVVLLQEPRPHTCRREDFLSYYETEDNIRKALMGDSYLRVA